MGGQFLPRQPSSFSFQGGNIAHHSSTNSPDHYRARSVFTLVVLLVFATPSYAQWTAIYRNAVDLGQTGNFNVDIEELSGVTYVGPVAGGMHRFLTIQDEGGVVALVDVSLSANGTVQTATAIGQVVIVDAPRLDTEGIAYTNASRNSVFIAYERDKDDDDVIPGVREYNLSTGNPLQSVALPAVWNVDGNTVSNRGFESVARMPHAKSMWTGNEEALTIDGDLANENDGTLIRLQKMSVNGNSVVANQQFPYWVDPVHSSNDPDRSGMADLVGLPDGTLMALERSVASSIQNRMYQVDCSSATNVSGAAFDGGLDNATFAAATKTLVWSGTVSGSSGANMEGLSLGPQLANGNWTLIGVVDNGSGSNGNYIVGFELVPPPAYGDFDQDVDLDCQDMDLLIAEIFAGTNTASFDLTGDGIVDAADQAQWLAEAATANGFDSPFVAGDANLDGAVDGLDFDVWNSNRFTANTSWCAGDFNLDGFVDGIDFNFLNAPADLCLLGDVDINGTVNFLDIAPFIAILSSGTYQCEADCDQSGTVDFLDISPFIALLSGA